MSSDDETLAGTPHSLADTVMTSETSNVALRMVDRSKRYEAGDLLGRGGMGEVRALDDNWIGRTVAAKTMRTELGQARFVREARIQGQLKHPNIVPVYDFALDPEGRPYFTMKRVSGHTLADIIAGLRRGDPQIRTRFNRHRLLGVFLDVCQAVAFAHRKGVLHRDIKPSNVIVGDFGEVYLLDWGVARVVHESEPETDTAVEMPPAGEEPPTEVGAVLGTLGYMSPEQMAGATIDERSDVHALGAVLYELLFLDRLYPGAALSVVARMAEPIDWTARTAGTSDVAPELVRICKRACEPMAADRHPDVLALVADIERYMAGDRDLALRRDLATKHVENATRLLGTGNPAERSTALRALGRAIALDPQQPEAATLLVRAFAEPPAQLPDEVRENVRGTEQEAMRLQARMGGYSYLFWSAFVLFPLWLGVKDPAAIIVLLVALVITTAQAFWSSSRAMSDRQVIVAGVLNAILVAVLSRLFGPLVLTPILAALATTMLMLQPIRKGRIALVAVGVGSLLGPWVLEKVGVLSPSYRFETDRIEILANASYFAATPAEFMLVVVSVASIVLPAVITTRLRRLLQDLQERVEVQAWQLRQVIPAGRPDEGTAS